jgi:gliding motility-associated-like protein
VGLNGVGTKAVNALSNYFKVTAFRDGKEKIAEFEKGILIKEHKETSSKQENGTEVVFIPEGFSPNGDGVLDKLVIVKPQSKRVSLEVFDRYGMLVYSSSDYQNDWDGTAQVGTILQGNQLPESTYYYLIQIEGELGVRKGYITLWR